MDLSRNEAITNATLQPFAALHDSLEYLRVGMSAGYPRQPRTTPQPPQIADVNKAAKAGETPLLLTSKNGHKDVVMTLLAAGARQDGGVAGSDRTVLLHVMWATVRFAPCCREQEMIVSRVDWA